MTRSELVAQAESHVRFGEENIYRQQHVIAQLAERGESTELAVALLDLFQAIQCLHVGHMERLRDQQEDLPHVRPCSSP